MSNYVALPTQEEDLVAALDGLIGAAYTEMCIRSVEWRIAHAYLEGARRIWVTDWSRGMVGFSWENDAGELEYRYEAVLYQYLVQLGRLIDADVHPHAVSDGFGLDSVRDAGMANAVLTYMIHRMGPRGVDAVYHRLIQTLLLYGTGGLYHFRCRGRDFGSRTSIEVVPPWELLPVPAVIRHRDDSRGVVRKRWVPLEWVKSIQGPSFDKKVGFDLSKLRAVSAPWGSSPALSVSTGGSASIESAWAAGGSLLRSSRERERLEASSAARKRRSKSAPSDDGQYWVSLEEVYLTDPQDYVARMILKIGGKILRDDDYESGASAQNSKIVCPLAVAQYIPLNGFYGRSYVGYLLGQNYENEQVLGNLFQNARDLDLFGMLVVPTGAGITRAQMEKPERRKIIMADPDMQIPTYKPYKIAPHTSGDFPAKAAQIGIERQEYLAGQSPLYSGETTGRVEGPTALGLIRETGDVNIVAPAVEIANAFVRMYQSMLQAAKTEITSDSQSGIKPPLIDDRMIGVVIDPETGEIDLDSHHVPDPWSITIELGGRVPRSKVQTQQSALLMLQSQQLTPTQFRILNIKEGWGFPHLDRSDYEAWRKTTLMKVLLFNDGRTPGRVFPGSEFDKPLVALAVVSEFMCGVEFSLASTEVQTEFIKLKRFYEEMAGAMPDQFPGIEGLTPSPGGQGGRPGQERREAAGGLGGPQTF